MPRAIVNQNLDTLPSGPAGGSDAVAAGEGLFYAHCPLNFGTPYRVLRASEPFVGIQLRIAHD